jgi:uncharacterized membrane protein
VNEEQRPHHPHAPLAGASPSRAGRQRDTFSEDFKRFFLRGLAALLPTLITLWLLVKIWGFLWESLGQHLLWAIKNAQFYLGQPYSQWGDIQRFWDRHPWLGASIGVGLAVVLVYVVGLFVGNLIGRTFWKLGETLVMKVPIIRAIYPAVKQITDFVLQERKQIQSSHVVAVQPHEKGIWSIGLVTGAGVRGLNQVTGQEMVSVFVPSSPTAFSGYVLVVPRDSLVELPMTVEEAMRLLVSGGVISPDEQAAQGEKLTAAGQAKAVLEHSSPASASGAASAGDFRYNAG